MPESGKPANLDHIKPHKPLIKPPDTTITTNINNMIRNNIRFSITIQLKNRMVSPSFFPIAHTGENSGQAYYNAFSLERYGLVISDYEWYLHTSRLKEIYHKQKNFISLMQRRQNKQNIFLEILQNKTQYDINTPSTFNQSEASPVIYYITPKAEASEPSSETKTTNVSTSVQNDTHKHINTEANTENRTVIQSLNIDNVVDRAVKTLEDKLRYDRLKKGW